MGDDHYIQSVVSIVALLGGFASVLVFFLKLSGAIDRLIKSVETVSKNVAAVVALVEESVKTVNKEVEESRDMATKEHKELLAAVNTSTKELISFGVEAQREMRVEHKELLERSLLFGERLKQKAKEE